MSSLTKPTRSPCSASSSARIGSTALHGPHQGAQKSTTTGRPAPRTSASKLSSVTSRIAVTLHTGPQQGAAPDGLVKDRAAHLRVSALAVGERDRHLDHAEARALGAIGRLDLERVALRRDRVHVDRLQDAAADALEAAGRILDA